MYNVYYCVPINCDHFGIRLQPPDRVIVQRAVLWSRLSILDCFKLPACIAWINQSTDDIWNLYRTQDHTILNRECMEKSEKLIIIERWISFSCRKSSLEKAQILHVFLSYPEANKKWNQSMEGDEKAATIKRRKNQQHGKKFWPLKKDSKISRLRRLAGELGISSSSGTSLFMMASRVQPAGRTGSWFSTVTSVKLSRLRPTLLRNSRFRCSMAHIASSAVSFATRYLEKKYIKRRFDVTTSIIKDQFKFANSKKLSTVAALNCIISLTILSESKSEIVFLWNLKRTRTRGRKLEKIFQYTTSFFLVEQAS